MLCGCYKILFSLVIGYQFWSRPKIFPSCCLKLKILKIMQYVSLEVQHLSIWLGESHIPDDQNINFDRHEKLISERLRNFWQLFWALSMINFSWCVKIKKHNFIYFSTIWATRQQIKAIYQRSTYEAWSTNPFSKYANYIQTYDRGWINKYCEYNYCYFYYYRW
jgi:hypothetical protein